MIGHTYTLTCHGLIRPGSLSRRYEVEVTEPRQLELEGMTLSLLDGEPDLPVGSRVRVWGGRWFYCESLDYIQAKKAEAEHRAEAIRVHEEHVKSKAVEAYLAPTQARLDGDPGADELRNCLALLQSAYDAEHRAYRRFWHASALQDKQKSNDALLRVNVIADSIQVLSKHAFERLLAHGLEGRTAYAYSPREGGGSGFYSPGREHFQLSSDVAVGRYRREAGDALCKPRSKFWGLEGLDKDRCVTCQTCLDRMLKLLSQPLTLNVQNLGPRHETDAGQDPSP